MPREGMGLFAEANALRRMLPRETGLQIARKKYSPNVLKPSRNSTTVFAA